jgi:hypothetical protein
MDSWYTGRRHEDRSSWSCGLAMVAPQKHNRQSLFFCLSSAVAHEALLLLAPKGNKKAQSSPLLLGNSRLRLQ